MIVATISIFPIFGITNIPLLYEKTSFKEALRKAGDGFDRYED